MFENIDSNLKNNFMSMHLGNGSGGGTSKDEPITGHHQQMLFENTTTSFDDLDTVEEINLNQHSLMKLRQPMDQHHSSQGQHHRVVTSKQQQQKQASIHDYYANAHNSYKHPFFTAQSQTISNVTSASEARFQPISILKRVDSSSKNVVSSSTANSSRIGVEGSTLPKNFTIHENSFAKPKAMSDYCDDVYGGRSQVPAMQTVRKRVQFANAPSMLSSASSDGDLSTMHNRRPQVT